MCPPAVVRARTRSSSPFGKYFFLTKVLDRIMPFLSLEVSALAMIGEKVLYASRFSASSLSALVASGPRVRSASRNWMLSPYVLLYFG